MLKVAAITSGRNLPSTRFRIRQHISPLREFGIEVTEYCPIINKYKAIPLLPGNLNRKLILPIYALWLGIKVITRMPALLGSYSNRITWLSREFLPGYPTLERCLKKPLVFDVDDAIWMTTPFGRSAVSSGARRADIIFAGNAYIANWFDRYSDNIIIIPTAIKTERFQQIEYNFPYSGKFIIGWTGSSSTLPFLEAIESPLNQFLEQNVESRLVVVSDKIPSFKHIPREKLQFFPWSEDNEVKGLQNMSVGLMPLPDNDWAKGKCSFKMLQYMACGIPVIVSPIGMNKEVLSLGSIGLSAQSNADWYDALCFFRENPERAREMGQEGRIVVKKNFDQKLITEKIAQIFRELGL